MQYKKVTILLACGVLLSVISRLLGPQGVGLTIKTENGFHYVPFNQTFSWLTLAGCSLVANAMMLLGIYRFFRGIRY